MNVTINIYGDVHIHCDCCDGCGEFATTLRKAQKSHMKMHPIRRMTAKKSSCPLRKWKLWSRQWRSCSFPFFRLKLTREAVRMKEFDVTITETLKLTVSVEASSKEEAQQMVSDQWHAGDHILDADNFVEVEFESNDGKEISAEREQNDTLEVLMVEPGQYPRVERIGSDLASLQKAVDGYIEAIYPYDDPVALICGEEAKLEGKPLNRALRDGDGDIYDIVAGKFFICGLGDENFASLPKELQQKYEEKFRQPEAFLKMGSKIMAIPTEPAKAAGKGKTAPATER